MKELNLNKIVWSMAVVILTAIVFMTGCGKKETAGNPDSNKQTQQTEKSVDEQINQSKNTSDNLSNDHIMVNLPTMQCATCKKNIETAMKKVDGVENVNVVVKEKIAHINYDKSKTDLSKIEYAITSAGYDANEKKADLEAYRRLDDCCKIPKEKK